MMIRVGLLILAAMGALMGQTALDGLITMNATSPSAPGTQLTPTILANGTVGSLSGYSITGTGSALTVGGHQPLCTINTPVSVGTHIYSPQATSQSIALNTASNFTYIGLDLPGSSTVSSLGACITFGGVPNITNLQDMMGMYGSSGGYVILQLRNGSCINIETDGSGTLHSGCITPSGTAPTYWCSMQANASTGTASLACYLPYYPYTQVGSTVTVSQKTTGSWGHTASARIGNAEVGTASATTYFENVMYDTTDGTFPLGVGTLSTQWASVLSPVRAMDWSTPGVSGGIPTRSTICSTLNPGATVAQIESAISGCSAGGVVYLNAGTYSLNDGIDFNGKSNVTLRGAGSSSTLLVFTGTGTACHNHYSNICLGQTSGETNWQGGPTNTANWTAGYNAGNTVITLSAVTNLKVGYPLILDQLDDTVDNSGVFVCSDPTIASPCSLEGNDSNGQRHLRGQAQIVTVADCRADHSSTVGAACNATTITITPGLRMANWSSAKTPQAWWATTPILNVGIENMSLDHTSATGEWGGIVMYNCQGCWVSGVRSIKSGKAHVGLAYANLATVRDSYFYGTRNAATQSYGVATYNAANALTENNIFHYVEGPMMNNSNCDGCVSAYNYTINDYYDVAGSGGWMQQAIKQHAAGTAMALYEGNVSTGVYADVFHGTHNLITYFRNRFVGNQPTCADGSGGWTPCTSPLNAFDLRSYSRYYNIVGNVLGENGTHNGYETGTKPIFALGAGNSASGVTVASDSLVATTLLRWGNYDTYNAAVRWVSGEVPTGIAGYSNAVPASQTLPSSFYLSAKPPWWPATKAWPPIGPDVTGGNIANVGGHAYTIPAQDCYISMGGPTDGTGAVLPYNADVCYYGAVTGGSQASGMIHSSGAVKVN
jgi:hypothetical protein